MFEEKAVPSDTSGTISENNSTVEPFSKKRLKTKMAPSEEVEP